MNGQKRFEGSFLGDVSRIADDTRLECKICWYVYDPAVGDTRLAGPARHARSRSCRSTGSARSATACASSSWCSPMTEAAVTADEAVSRLETTFGAIRAIACRTSRY